MIDAGTLDLHQDLVLCDRRPRCIVEHQLPTVLKQTNSLHRAPREFLGTWLPTQFPVRRKTLNLQIFARSRAGEISPLANCRTANAPHPNASAIISLR